MLNTYSLFGILSRLTQRLGIVSCLFPERVSSASTYNVLSIEYKFIIIILKSCQRGFILHNSDM